MDIKTMEQQVTVHQSSMQLAPIFLVGAERSGTTVLRLMLDHHPDITWCSEFEYAVDRVSDEGEWPSMDTYYEWLETHRIFQSHQFAIDPTLSYPELMNSFLVQRSDRHAKPVIGATVHRHFDRLLKLWPNARFIHIVRDGRDVTRSCIRIGWAGNVWTGIERWMNAEQLWSTLKESLPADRYVETTYEQLITDPEGILTQICAFIGVEYNPDMMAYAESTTYDKPDARFITKWKKSMSEREIRLVESRVADLLVQRGYQLSGLPTLKLTSWIKIQLRIQDRWGRIQARLKRYGLKLIASDFLSRKLNLTAWQKQTRLAMNAIEQARLK
jgi:hypothetical protein